MFQAFLNLGWFEKNPVSGCWGIQLLVFSGHLNFKHSWFQFGPLSFSFKFEKGLISGCCYIQLLIHWGFLLFGLVFVSSIYKFGWFLKLKFKIWERTFNTEVFFHLGWPLFQTFIILVWILELNFEIWERSNQWLMWYSTFDILRSSFIWVSLCFEHF